MPKRRARTRKLAYGRVIDVAFAHHDTLEPNVVDVVNFSLGGEPPTGRITVIVINRGTDPLFFDFTYPDGSGPVATIAPEADDTFIVRAGERQELAPTATQTYAIALVASSAVPYSVEVYY